ncbi:hypothetical protein [Fodinicurvata sp. EGI_FJ10296]|uniref:hypothetical protein n=1 Tax=Fodinicurvata sp. EGI_FJ10296 TaxID=3231908 RepID=UPI00345119B6
MRIVAKPLFALGVAIMGLSIVQAAAAAASSGTHGTDASIIVVAGGPPYGCGAPHGSPGTAPGCRRAPHVNNPRRGIIHRLQSEPSAHIRLAIQRCVNGMRGARWKHRYEACYYPALEN